MEQSGERVLDFALPGTTGGEIETYRLSEHVSDGPVVLVFYPFDFSPVCTKVVCDFRDAEWLTLSEGVDVFGVSRDSCYAHRRFIDEYDIPFPLLSDTSGRVIELFDLLYEEWEGHEGVAKRALITIDSSQTIQYRWQTEDAYESPTLDELRDAIPAYVA